MMYFVFLLKGPTEIHLHGVQDKISNDKDGTFILKCTITRKVVDCFPRGKTIVASIGDIGNQFFLSWY